MDDAQDLVGRLCAWTGMIMEDVSAIAILTSGEGDAAARVEQIRCAAADIGILADAALIVLRRRAISPSP